MAEKDYYSFDEVLADLRMEEDELKRLVSAGEIRAFRDRDTMRFKAEDIERIRTGSRARVGERVELDLGRDLDLDDDLGVAPGDELVLEDEPADVEEVDLAGEADAEPRRRSPRVAVTAAPEEASEGAGLKFALVLGFVVLLFANFAALGAASGRTNALTRFLADLFAG